MPSNVILILVARACSTCTSSLVNPFSFQFVVLRLRRYCPDGTVPVPTLLMAWMTATTFPNASWTGTHAILLTLFGSILYAAATSRHTAPSSLSKLRIRFIRCKEREYNIYIIYVNGMRQYQNGASSSNFYTKQVHHTYSDTFTIFPERAELLSTPSPIGTWAWLSVPSMCLQHK